MIELVRKLKTIYELKQIAVSIGARELNAYRIQKFKLGEFVDTSFHHASSNQCAVAEKYADR